MDAVQARKLDNHVDWKLLNCWAHRAAISSLKPIWRPITTDQPQGLTLGLIFNSFINDVSNGTKSPLRKSAHNTEEWLMIKQMGLLPLRGTSTGWRNEMTRHSESAPKGNVKSSTWGGIKPCLWSHWESIIWKAAWKRSASHCPFCAKANSTWDSIRESLTRCLREMLHSL